MATDFQWSTKAIPETTATPKIKAKTSLSLMAPGGQMIGCLTCFIAWFMIGISHIIGQDCFSLVGHCDITLIILKSEVSCQIHILYSFPVFNLAPLLLLQTRIGHWHDMLSQGLQGIGVLTDFI